MKAQALRAATSRLAVLRAVLIALFVLLAARAAHLTLVDPRGGERAKAQTHASLALAPARGLIVDRSGKELAVGTRAPSIYASPRHVESPDVTARSLARVLELDAGRVARRMRGSRGFTFVARWVTPEQARRVEALDLPGVGVVHEPRRAYPARELAAPLLGFTNIDGKGVRGIEQQEDAWLAGTAERVPVERDARGRLLAEAAPSYGAARGGDVMLTIDAALQAEAEAALRDGVEATGARGGVVVAIEPSSGAILSLAETPGFDPNAFRETPYPATRSRAFLDAWEPGSTLKVFLAAAALDSGVVGEHELIDTESGSYRVPGKTIRDAHDYGILSLGGVLRVSSNVGAVKLAERLGPRAHHRALLAFGLGTPTGSGFPDESSGLVRGWQSWKPVDHATIAFGQGLAATPVQLAAATATLANGGEWVTPRLVAARRPAGGAWRGEPAGARRRVISEATAQSVLRMMEGVVAGDGTGRRAGLRDVRVAGKTGTAQKLDPATGRYAPDRFIAWFVGVVPADRPLLAIVVGIDDPRGAAHTGGAAAAPVFARVAAAHLAGWGIVTEPAPIRAIPREAPPDGGVRVAREQPERAPRRVAAVPAVAAAPPAKPAAHAPAAAAAQPPEPIAVLTESEERVLLPDFAGLSVDEVVQLTRAVQVEVEITGRGRAVSQDPAPGTILVGSERRVRVSFGDAGDARAAPGAPGTRGGGEG